MHEHRSYHLYLLIICADGYYYGGTDCDNDIDVCGHWYPCQYGASCDSEGANAYSCQCSPGYTGTNCDVPIGVYTCVHSLVIAAHSTPNVNYSHH